MKLCKFKNIFVLMACFVLLLLAALPLTPPGIAFAEESAEVTRTDANFSMTMTAINRQNDDLAYRVQTDESGKISYFCFDWRQLERLDFHFTANSSNMSGGEYKFLVTYAADDKLQSHLNGTTEKLYEGLVGDFTILDLYYNIDKSTSNSSIPRNFNGHDFGLYKFDFVYSQMVNGEFKDIALGDSIYVAVFPDTNIKEIVQDHSDMEILYYVSSSNGLMNVFNLSLSDENALRYVRPDRITWVAYGTGLDKVDYVLTNQMKNLDSSLTHNVVLWQSYYKQNGTSFVLDSKEIEGIWTAYCIIKDYDNQEILRVSTTGLSTIKEEQKSSLWLILLLVGISLFVLLVIALVIMFVMKRKEQKVW